MNPQNVNTHKRYVPGYHLLLSSLLLIGTIAAVINVFRHKPDEGGFISTLLILLLFICAMLVFLFVRQFPLKAQDRAIRAEESLRYYILTQKVLSSSLTVHQVAALRFAPDDEFVPLVEKAIAESLSPDDIKKSIKNWRPDNHRV
jgi:uncharacterized membrane protein YsdA (DUF1294 family)